MSLQERFNHFVQTLKPISLPPKCLVLSDLHAAGGDDHDPLRASGTEAAILDLLRQYFDKEYALLKNGDWWDTWRGETLTRIYSNHQALRNIVSEFASINRLYETLGNHERNLFNYPEALIFSGFGKKIFLDHGYFEDWPNDSGWEVGRFAVRAADKLGLDPETGKPYIPPTSPHPSNPDRHSEVRTMRAQLAKDNPDYQILYGHTHYAECSVECEGFGKIDIPNYWNSGSPVTGTVTYYTIEEGNFTPHT